MNDSMAIYQFTVTLTDPPPQGRTPLVASWNFACDFLFCPERAFSSENYQSDIKVDETECRKVKNSYF